MKTRMGKFVLLSAVIVILAMGNVSNTVAQTSVNFHEDIEEGETFKWKVRKLESAYEDLSESQIQEGDTIEIEVTSDPNSESVYFYTDAFRTTVNGDSITDDGSLASLLIVPISFTISGVVYDYFDYYGYT